MAVLSALLERENKKAGARGRVSSCEQTVYTVETTLTSIQKACKRPRKNPRAKNKNARRVHFSKSEDGEIHCSTIIVDRFEDKSLWFSRADIKKIREAATINACLNHQDHHHAFALAALKVLKPGEGKEESKKNGRRFMELLALCSDLRGLENVMAPQINKVVKSHISATLAAQAKSKDEAMIRFEARKISKRSVKMARQVAIHDTKEALRANFSIWRPQTVLEEV